MLHIPCIQGTEYWKNLRYGIVTATGAENIITPAKALPTKGEKREKYMRTLLCELILGQPIDTEFVSAAMIHGTDSEDKARAAYAFEFGAEPIQAGFVVSDDRTIGCSPDNFLEDDGLLEIKCPFSPVVHLGYMLNPQSLVDEYWLQVQTQLFITDRGWCDLIAYNIAMPEMVRVRVEPDAEWQDKFRSALTSFSEDFGKVKSWAVERGWLADAPYDERIESGKIEAGDDFGVSDADVDAILQGRAQ